MKTQLWWCPMCGTLGAVRYQEHDDVTTVLHLQVEQHGKARPMCPMGVMGFRSIIPENIKEPFIHTTEGRYVFSE